MEYEGPDYYAVCHGTPIRGMPFSVAGPVARDADTDADGNATFAALPPGRYAIVGGPPGDFVRNAFFCAPTAAPGTSFPFTETGIVGIALDLAAGDDVVCDWYSVPEDRRGDASSLPGTSTLTIHHRNCPVPDVAPAELFAVCHDTPVRGWTLAVQGPVERLVPADAEGNATFAGLPPGDYAIARGGGPTDLVDLTAFCAPVAQPGTEFPASVEAVRGAPGSFLVHLALAPGDDVLCDLYIVHPDLGPPATPSSPTRR